MTGGYLSDAGTFLVDTVFGLYILAVLLRFLFQLLKADFYNPVSQFLVKITNPPLVRMRRFIPGFWGIDLAAVVLLLVLECAKLGLTAMMLGHVPGVGGLMLLALASLLKTATYVFIVAIFIRVILSWVNPNAFNPVVRLLYSFTEPIMAPARRLIPAMGGLDLSPIIVFIALTLFLKLVVQPIFDLGRLAF